MLTAVVLTALRCECEAILEFLESVAEEVHPQGTVYEVGRFAAWRVAVTEIGPGNANAALETERALSHFSPQVALFIGVAGGIKDVTLGDVVVATKVYGYEYGKAEERFLPRPEVGRTSHFFEQRARVEARKRRWTERLPPGSASVPRVFVQPIAAGAKVIASMKSETWKFLRSQYGDAVAVEMEGHGFLRGAFAHSGVQVAVVRGISDLIEGKAEADLSGSQEQASRNASAFAVEMLDQLAATFATVESNEASPPAQQRLHSDVETAPGKAHDPTFQIHQRHVAPPARWDTENEATPRPEVGEPGSATVQNVQADGDVVAAIGGSQAVISVRRQALLLGSTHYDDSQLSLLPTPAHNVEALAEVLQDEEIGAFEVDSLVDAPRAQAERAIVDLFKHRAQEDVLLLYFCGHGLKDDQGELYLAVHETETDVPEATAVSSTFIRSMVDKSYSRRIVVILDCCFSGAFTGDTMSPVGENAGVREAFQGTGYGRIVLTATNSVQYAWERDRLVGGEESSSIFTRFLVEGLRTGDADHDNDGEITVKELYDYAHGQVVSRFPKQTPQWFAYEGGDFKIARNPRPKQIPEALAKALEHHDPLHREVAVRRLGDLLLLHWEHNPPLADAIRDVLKRHAEDEDPGVAQAARLALDQLELIPATGERRRLQIFLSSPADVTDGREVARQVVEQLRQNEKIRSRADLEIVSWDDPERQIPFFANRTPQESVIEKLGRPAECDIVVVLLWARMGTPLPETEDFTKPDGSRYLSGTEWEYLDAFQASRDTGRPDILVYRCLRDLTIFKIGASREDRREAVRQLDLVDEFCDHFRDEEDGSLSGGINTYATDDDLERQLRDHLTTTILKQLSAASERIAEEKEDVPHVSPTAAAQAEMDAAEDVDRLLEPYLDWLEELHSRLELRGIGGDLRLPTVPLEKVYVALKGVRASSHEREQSERLLEAEFLDMVEELEGEYTAGELSREFALLRRRAIVEDDVMPSIWERDRDDERPVETVPAITLGQAFREERWMVILGDPGSGKTTLARWLTLQLARALREGERRVEVSRFQIDPELPADDGTTVDLGPPRLPVLVRVSDFANARRRDPILGLIDYLGYHPWLGQVSGLRGDRLNALIRRYLREGRAVIVLDGMDEITAASQRDEVVHAIETFVRVWINGRGDLRAAHHLWDRIYGDTPASRGGNQILITSRIAGYHASPISGEMTHVTIRPMSRLAVEHFCDAWMLAVYELLAPEEKPEKRRQAATQEATELKANLFDPARPRVAQLAANPLLVTILALIYRNNKGSLPQQRAEIYQRALEILVEAWRVTGLKTEELVYLLSPVAARIHECYNTGLIEEDELREVLTEHLAAYRQLDPEDLAPSFVAEVDAFLSMVREEVGLLTERSPGVYGFVHLTFQEYLTALALVGDREHAAEKIVLRLEDPRWRESILLALGHVSINKNWGPKARQKLLRALLDADDHLGDLVPRSALLIVTAMPEMARVPSRILTEIARLLLMAYSDRDGAGRFAKLKEQIETAFASLRGGLHAGRAVKVLEKALLAAESEPQLAQAAAVILRQHRWFGSGTARALLTALDHDSPEDDWPIHGALQELLTPQLPPDLKEPKPPKTDSRGTLEKLRGELEKIDSGEAQAGLETGIAKVDAEIAESGAKDETSEQAKARLTQMQAKLEALRSGARKAEIEQKIRELEEAPVKYEKARAEYERRMVEIHCQRRQEFPVLARMRFYAALDRNPELEEHINNDPLWLRLAIVLYGGEADHGAAETIREYDEIAFFLQKEDASRQMYIENDLYQDKWGRGKWGDDPVYNMAVYLDKGMDGRLDRARRLPRFSRHHIFRDSPLTQQILLVLRRKEKASALELLDTFRSTWHQDLRAEARVDALLGLLALGEDVVPEMDTVVRDPDRAVLAQRVLDRLRYLQRLLNDAVVRIDGSKEARGLVFEDLTKLRKELREDHWTRIVALVVRILAAPGHRPIDMGPLLDVSDNSYVHAEAWAFWYTNWFDEPVYSFAVVLDTLSKQISSAKAISCAHLAQNLRFERDVTLSEVIPPRYTDSTELLGDVFTVAGSLRGTLAQHVIWSLGLIQYHGKPLTKKDPAHVDCLAEVMTFTLERRDEVLSDLASELKEKSEFELLAEVIEKALALEDPAIRSRALWRLSRFIEIWRGRRLLEEAVDSAEEIADPLARSRAFERLLPRVPRKQRSNLLQQAVDSAREIDDPENRSRALGRMALASPSGEAEALWQEALGASEHITEPGHRVETLVLLQPHLSRFPDLLERTRQLLAHVEDPWHRLDGQGLLSTKLLEIHPRLKNAVTWVPVVLAAVAKDLTDRYTAIESLDALWNRLTRADHRDAALRELLHRGMVEGIELTQHVAQSLGALLDEGDEETVARLMPLVQRPGSAALEFVEGCLSHRECRIAQHAALLLAESGPLTVPILSSLIALIEKGPDRSRHRASLVLHGGVIDTRNRNQELRTSSLGLELMLALGRQWQVSRLTQPSIAQVLAWATQNILHDDPELLRSCAELIEDSEKGAAARTVLRSIESLSEDASEVFFELMLEKSPAVREALLLSYFRVANSKQFVAPSGERNEQIGALIEALGHEEETSLRVVGERSKSVVEAMRHALEQRDKADSDEADPGATSDLVTAAEAALRDLAMTPKTMSVEALGQGLYFRDPHDDRQAREMAQSVAESPPMQELLVEWLSRTLRETYLDENIYFKRAALLYLASHVAPLAPAAFATAAETRNLGDHLLEAARYNDRFYGREGAAKLVGYLRRVSSDVVEFLESALRDVHDVQTAALQTARRLRHIDEGILPRLLENLYHPNASLAYATGQVLSAFGRNEKLRPQQRQTILGALADAVRDPRSQRGVYFMTGSGWKDDPHRVSFFTRLDQAFYKVLLEIAGVV